MEGFKVKQVQEMLGVSHVAIHKRLRNHKKELQDLVYKRGRTTYLKPEAVTFLETVMNINKKTASNSDQVTFSESRSAKEKVTLVKPDVELHSNLHNELHERLQKNQENQISDLREIVKKRDGEIDKLTDTIQQMIKIQAEAQERTDTIIMKLTQDLNQTRKLIENKTPIEIKQEETKKTDKVISIKEFVETKVDKEIEKKKKNEDPLQGRSTLYKIYVKMFHPYKLRKRA